MERALGVEGLHQPLDDGGLEAGAVLLPKLRPDLWLAVGDEPEDLVPVERQRPLEVVGVALQPAVAKEVGLDGVLEGAFDVLGHQVARFPLLGVVAIKYPSTTQAHCK